MTARSQDSGYDYGDEHLPPLGRADAPRNYASVDAQIVADLAQRQPYELDYDKR